LRVNHIYKTVELVGSSTTGTDDAIRNAIAKASHTLRNLRWFQVVETRGQIDNNQVSYWQVTIKVSFRLEDTP
jgi:flavin-binding protein dodecin